MGQLRLMVLYENIGMGLSLRLALECSMCDRVEGSSDYVVRNLSELVKALPRYSVCLRCGATTQDYTDPRYHQYWDYVFYKRFPELYVRRWGPEIPKMVGAPYVEPRVSTREKRDKEKSELAQELRGMDRYVSIERPSIGFCQVKSDFGSYCGLPTKGGIGRKMCFLHAVEKGYM